MGTYGVDSILECEDLRKAMTGVVLSANDPVAAYWGVDILRKKVWHRAHCSDGTFHRQRRGRVDHPGAAQGPGVQRAVGGAALGDSIIEVAGPQAGAAARPGRERVRIFMTDKQNRFPRSCWVARATCPGELLRLIVGHPNFTLAGVMSDSSPASLRQVVPASAGCSRQHRVQVAGGLSLR
jgi:hypothetical protein